MIVTMHKARAMRASLLLAVISAVFGVCVPCAGSVPGPQVIRLTAVQTSNHPNGKKSSWTSRLLNQTRQFGKPAGAAVGAEVGFSNGPQLTGAIRLPGGVLEYTGKTTHLPRHGGIVVPVVDGSGSFTGVHGTYTRSAGDKTHPTTIVLRLQYS